MQIDPKISMWLNIFALVMSVLAMAGWWGDLLGQHTAAIVTGIMTTAVSALNVVLHAYSPPQAGPAAPHDQQASSARVLVPLAILVLGLSMFAGPAFAGNRSTPLPRPRPAAASATAPAATSATPANPLQGLLDLINKKAAALNAFTVADAQAAITMATGPNPAQPIDPAGLACYQAVATKLQTSQPGAVLPKSLGALQLLEAARLAKLQVTAIQSGNDPVVIACAPLILDAQTTLLMLAGQGAIGVATSGLLP